MARNNGSSSVKEETIQSLLKTIKVLETLEAIQAGIKAERAQRAMAGIRKGYLCIGGKSLLDIQFVSFHSA
jgi:hypothetical protein